MRKMQWVTLKTGNLDECYVQMDRAYMVQLLTNLVENALKYSQSVDALVLVETASQSVEGQLWSQVSVKDNGPGIPADHLPKIFHRFYRLDEARTHQPDTMPEQISGSGLGLAIAMAIAQANGGDIKVLSQLGLGTTFTVWLPAASDS